LQLTDVREQLVVELKDVVKPKDDKEFTTKEVERKHVYLYASEFDDS
jgi:hypothetical protein